MKNKIDQFFKDKLETHHLPPSEEAWARVEANLSKKNNVFVWRMAAAILTVGALVTAILWSQRSADQQLVIANHLPMDSSAKEKEPQQPSIEKKVTARPLPGKTSMAAVAQPRISKEQHNKPVAAEERGLKEKKLQSTEESIAAVEKLKIKETGKQEATSPEAIASTRHKSIKLEFTLEDFSSEAPVATANEEKSSGLKKVWELAREVKNGDGPVREIKNELFARNFKKNKDQ